MFLIKCRVELRGITRKPYFSSPFNSRQGAQSSPDSVGGGRRTGEFRFHALGRYHPNQETDRAYQIDAREICPPPQDPSTELTLAESCGLTQGRTPPTELVTQQLRIPRFHSCTIHSPMANQYLFQSPTEGAGGPQMFSECQKKYISDNNHILYTIYILFLYAPDTTGSTSAQRELHLCISSERM